MTRPLLSVEEIELFRVALKYRMSAKEFARLLKRVVTQVEAAIREKRKR